MAPAAAPLAAFSLRLLVEPSAYMYYAGPLVLAALLTDLAVLRWRLPVLTAFATAGWLAVQFSDTPRQASVIRLTDYALLLVAAVALALWRRPSTADPRASQPA